MNKFNTQMRSKLEELFGADLRSLALMRISLAIVILFDLIRRLPDLVVFYTDAGLLPRTSVVTNYPDVISLHLLNGTAFVQGALFLIQGLCALSLLVGYRTRLVMIISWFFMASLHWRN